MQVPDLLINSLANVTGFDKEAFLAVHASGEQVVSIRINPAKISHDLINTVFAENIKSMVPWSTNGYYLQHRPSFTLDPLFHAGAYYVQEASSMFLEEALKQTVDLSQPLKILDLCAAPGGKSTLIQSIVSAESLLVSNEVIKTRVNVLAENMIKWGSANVIVTNNDPKDFQRLPGYFDVVIIDAPCSGSGLFRKDPKAIGEWSEQNVALCSQRQQRILADALPSLKPGGVIIYCTCSYSTEEDEEIADWLISEYGLSSVKLQLPGESGIVETMSPLCNAYGYRFYPDKIKGEGFFLAVFKKEMDSLKTDQSIRQKKQSAKQPANEAVVIKPWLQRAGNFFFIKQNEETIAIPLQLEKELGIIQSALYIKKAGVKLGAVIRNELIPDHELALSTIVGDAIPVVEMEKEMALQYLRRKDIHIDVSKKPGWAMISYHQLPLGWIKILPNRINNYYPKDWRILNK